ncbi:hemolysin III family protein [Carnobacteriaceae bacterium 52-44]
MTKTITKSDIVVEVFNAITHGIAALLGVVAMIFLLDKALSYPEYIISEIVAYTIYGTSLIILFLSSTLYHSFSFSNYKDLFQKIDHASIYLLIAGTYTPYLMITVGGMIGYIFLAVVWIAALAGIIFEVVWTNRYPRLSTYLYLIMGWLGIFLIYPLYQSLHISGVILLFLGGLFYSIGTIFYRIKHLNWMHIIWHLFVVAGAAFMYFSIFLYV